MWLNPDNSPLKATLYKSARLSAHPRLIVILHGDLMAPGDSRSGTPSYHYIFAGRAAEQMQDVVVAALVRPGYADSLGDQSAGERGMRTGDNYTSEVVGRVAGAIEELKGRISPSTTVLAGHSGGAAIAGALLGRYPSGVKAALLVSCPCDVPAWRRHMIQETFKKDGPFSVLFALPVKSLSPMDVVSRIETSTRVRMVVGSLDRTAPPRFTEEYADALRKQGVDVVVTIAPGLEHDVLLEPVVMEQLKRLVETAEHTVSQKKW